MWKIGAYIHCIHTIDQAYLRHFQGCSGVEMAGPTFFGAGTRSHTFVH